ncbi:MAG: DUF2235 domain-containing protein [Pseudomonadota bacterium]
MASEVRKNGKNILIFSDGTGQIGGLRPDQRLSNIYKMYRAMRPGPDSPIKPSEQYAFYDPGLGTGEVGGLTFRRIRNILAAAVGTGIDENVIDCYQAIISQYEPGDRICLFGFSRGAYTVRSLANVLNLCGVPTHDSNGNPVPRYGPAVRKIASDAVRYVYNHGAGAKREKYEDEREEKASRFRKQYGSEGVGADGEGQGNVQPHFVGAFDTVAALGSRTATIFAFLGFAALAAVAVFAATTFPWWFAALIAVLPLSLAYWFLKSLRSQFKYFLEDPDRRLRWWNPLDLPAAISNGHFAWWSGKNYDRYIDREVPYLRHALSIDEDRAKFPRVGWARLEDYRWHLDRGRTDWLKQVWFAGNHSDIGGSYPEEESRLSDIALQWMIKELEAAMPGQIRIRHELLMTSPDPTAVQHDERIGVLNMQPKWLRKLTGSSLTWRRKVRKVRNDVSLHPSVKERFQATSVPYVARSGPYRPENLSEHGMVKQYY